MDGRSEMAIELSEDRKRVLIERIRGFHLEEFDEDVSVFRAESLLDFFLDVAAPQIYNQAVQDARLFMLKRLEDLEGDVYAPEV